MIKTFEEFLCEGYKHKRPKVITKLEIYSDDFVYDDSICKTWDDVIRLFSNPKYNVPCAMEFDNTWQNWEKCKGTLSQTLKQIDKQNPISKHINKHIYIYNGDICIEIIHKSKIEFIKLHILTELGQKTKKTTDLSQSPYHTKIRIDLLDEYDDLSNSNINSDVL